MIRRHNMLSKLLLIELGKEWNKIKYKTLYLYQWDAPEKVMLDRSHLQMPLRRPLCQHRSLGQCTFRQQCLVPLVMVVMWLKHRNNNYFSVSLANLYHVLFKYVSHIINTHERCLPKSLLIIIGILQSGFNGWKWNCPLKWFHWLLGQLFKSRLA